MLSFHPVFFWVTENLKVWVALGGMFLSGVRPFNVHASPLTSVFLKVLFPRKLFENKFQNNILHLISNGFLTIVETKGFKKFAFSWFRIPNNIGQKAGSSLATICNLALLALFRRFRVLLANSCKYCNASGPVH